MATTVSRLADDLKEFVEPGTAFVKRLNRLLPRVYAMGYWPDLLYDLQISTDHAYITLPRDTASIVASMVENDPVPTKSQWHDYKITGLTSGGTMPIFGLVDDGFWPTIIDLDGDDETYQLALEPISPDTLLPEVGSVVVSYEEEDLDDKEYTFTLDGTASMTTAFASGSQAIRVTNIRFVDVERVIRVKATAVSVGGTDLTLAEGRGDSVARYRRYRLHNSTGDTQTVRLFLKRKFERLYRDSEVVYLDNIEALKHAFLGAEAEEAADTDRASYHWGMCNLLLEQALDEYRGGAKPQPKIDPYGSGDSVINLM